MPSVDEFRNAISAQIVRARNQNRPHVEINAGELHRALGGYPGNSHQMPSCCAAMRVDYENTRPEVVFNPQSGDGASLTIRYVMLDAA